MPTVVVLKNKEKQRKYVAVTRLNNKPNWTKPTVLLHPGDELEFVLSDDEYIQVREGNGLEKPND